MDTCQTQPGQTQPDNDIATCEDLFSLPEPGVCLFFHGGSRDNTSMRITRAGVFTLGRGASVEIRFRDGDRVDSTVSRRHATLHVDSEKVLIINGAPKNGLKVDGVELKQYQELVLNDADVITLGKGGPNIRVRIGSLRDITA